MQWNSICPHHKRIWKANKKTNPKCLSINSIKKCHATSKPLVVDITVGILTELSDTDSFEDISISHAHHADVSHVKWTNHELKRERKRGSGSCVTAHLVLALDLITDVFHALALSQAPSFDVLEFRRPRLPRPLLAGGRSPWWRALWTPRAARTAACTCTGLGAPGDTGSSAPGPGTGEWTAWAGLQLSPVLPHMTRPSPLPAGSWKLRMRRVESLPEVAALQYRPWACGARGTPEVRPESRATLPPPTHLKGTQTHKGTSLEKQTKLALNDSYLLFFPHFEIVVIVGAINIVPSLRCLNSRVRTFVDAAQVCAGALSGIAHFTFCQRVPWSLSRSAAAASLFTCTVWAQLWAERKLL